MTTRELITDLTLLPVPKARNLDSIGWRAGYLVVRFKAKADLWVYGPQIPEIKAEQIVRNPFPDSLFSKAIKAKYKCHHVGH